MYRYDIQQTSTILLTMSILGFLNAMHRPEVKSVGEQCDLLAAPPLKKFPKVLSKVSIIHDESLTTDPEDSDMVDLEETDLDSSFQITQDDTTTE